MNDKINQYLEHVKNLPPSPTLMVELVNLLKKPDRDIDQLVHLLSHDLAVTAEILKLCNSALFGSNDPATDMFEATFRLGFYEVYRVAIALSGSRTMNWWAAHRGLDLESVWEHSALTALSAQLLAKEVHASDAVAYTAGLLHDVGKIVLACAEGAAYGRLIREAAGKSLLIQAETAQFGFDHAQVGGCVLARWQLPAEIVVPVVYHHCPEQAGAFQNQAAILNLADAMAHRLNPSSSNLQRKSPSSDFSSGILQIKPARLAALTLRAKEEASRVKELFRKKS